MLSINNYENADAVVIRLLKYLKINTRATQVIGEFDRHPDHPSLLSISDVLSNFGVNNSAFRIDESGISNVPCPFIAHTNRNNDFVLVDGVDAHHVTVTDHLKRKQVIPREEFKKLFNGVVLTVDNNEQQANENIPAATSAKQIFEGTVSVVALLLLVLIIVFNINAIARLGWQNTLLVFLQFTGLAAAVLLLAQSLDANNPLVNKLCNSISPGFSCNEILSSKAAKVFDGLSWSEVGFFYFAGTSLLLVTCPAQGRQIFTLLSLISLPFTVYSFYYQGRIAKKWCLLCCAVQTVLLAEGLLLNSNLQFNFNALLNTAPGTWALMFMYLLLPAMGWLLLRPLFTKLKQLKPLQKQLKTFKYNNDLFNTMLRSQTHYQLPDEKWSIVLGNRKAENIITIVTNPYCSPCAQTHADLDKLLAQSPHMQARVVFTATNTDDDIRTPVARQLMALNELGDENRVGWAMNDWYSKKQKNYDLWANAHQVDLNPNHYYKLDRQREWCKMAEVTHTPTILINGYRLPELYQVADLKYMLQ